MNNAFYSFFDSATKKVVEFICPSCGHLNKISNNKCESCSYDMSQTKSIMFSHYTYFNTALIFEREGKYFDAIIEISKFLAYEPKDEVANKLYIYYLNKLGRKDDIQAKLDKFEEMFPRNPWIIQVEMKGLDNIESPAESQKDINFDIVTDQLLILSNELAKTKIQTTSELGSIAINFYSNLLRPAKADKNLYARLSWFYDNVIIPQLAKREIRLEIFEGKNYNDLSTEDVACLDVKSTIEYKGVPDGTIITDVPAVYIRSSLIQKQQIYVVKNPTKKKRRPKQRKTKRLQIKKLRRKNMEVRNNEVQTRIFIY